MDPTAESLFPDETRLADQEVVLGGRYRVLRELGRGAMGTWGAKRAASCKKLGITQNSEALHANPASWIRVM